MSVKLERDLRIYMSYLDTLVPTITADQLVEPVVARSPAPALPPPSSRRGWVVAATAATVAVVLLVGSLILVSSGPRSDPAPVATRPPIGSVSSLATDPVDDCEAVRVLLLHTVEAVPCDEGVDITGWTLSVDGPFVSIQMQVDSDPMITDWEHWHAEFAVENDGGGFVCGFESNQASASDVESFVYDYSGAFRLGGFVCDASVELNDMGALITLRMDLTAASGMPPACDMRLRGHTVRDSGTASSRDNLFDHLKSVDEFGRITPEGLVLVDDFEWSVDASDPETIICN
jgi:hypothetical protein